MESRQGVSPNKVTPPECFLMYNIFMNRERYIESLQNYVVSLLRKGNESKPLWMLAKYNCSEVSWLVGLKVAQDLGEKSDPFTLKGDVNNGIEKAENAHDILGYFDPDSKDFVILDPTIWQFYPEAESIFIGSFETIEKAIAEVSKHYQGDWKLSYRIKDIHEDVSENLKIIRANCDQSPNWK